jgi:hypothetical protein
MKPRSRTQIVAAVLGMHAVYSVNIPRSMDVDTLSRRELVEK